MFKKKKNTKTQRVHLAAPLLKVSTFTIWKVSIPFVPRQSFVFHILLHKGSQVQMLKFT